MNHKTATELPWDDTHIVVHVGRRADLYVHPLAADGDCALHAANAYPKLVAAMKDGSKAAIEAALKECGEL